MKSIFQVFSLDILSKIVLGITGIILIRFMEPSEYARYILAVSAITIVTQAFSTSFNRLYIVGREKLSQDNNSGFLGFQLSALLVLALAGLPLVNRIGPIYWFILFAAVATALTEFSKTFFQEQLRFLRFSFIELFRTILILAGVMVCMTLVGKSLEAWQVLMVQFLGMIIVFSIAFGRRLEFGRMFKIAPAFSLIKNIVVEDYGYLFGYFFLFSFFGQLDIFMLRSLADSNSVAAYGSAFRYYALVILALSSVHAVLLPLTQKAGSIGEIKATNSRYTRLVLFLIPIILAGAWLSQWIIPMIDGGKYPQAIAVFRILAVSSILSLLFSPYVNTVMKFARFKFMLMLVSVAIALGILLNLLLAPALGAIGTAVSTLISFAFVNCSTFLKGRSLLNSSTHFPDQDSTAISSMDDSQLAVRTEGEAEKAMLGR